jgi:hypothetical protein
MGEAMGARIPGHEKILARPGGHRGAKRGPAILPGRYHIFLDCRHILEKSSPVFLNG